MNTSEGQTQDPVGGGKQVFETYPKLAEIIEWFANNVSCPGTQWNELLRQINNSLSNCRTSSLQEGLDESTPPPAPIKTEGEDELTKLPFPDTTMRLEIGKLEVNCFDEDQEMSIKVGRSRYQSLSLEEVQELSHFIQSHIYNETQENVYLFQHQIPAAPPSPVGIDVEALIKQVGYIKRNAEKINEHTWRVYTEQILGHIEDIESGYSAYLPQSSTEEEKELWRELYNTLDDFGRDIDAFEYGLPIYSSGVILSTLQSKFKISKR